MTLQTLILEGGNALSDFRVQQLRPRLQAICPQVSGLSGQFLHLVASASSFEGSQTEVLKQLLTYGDPFQIKGPSDAAVRVCVSPRLGTVSPWASKATDIAHNCGLDIRRIERLVEYTLLPSNLKALKTNSVFAGGVEVATLGVSVIGTALAAGAGAGTGVTV